MDLTHKQQMVNRPNSLNVTEVHTFSRWYTVILTRDGNNTGPVTVDAQISGLHYTYLT